MWVLHFRKKFNSLRFPELFFKIIVRFQSYGCLSTFQLLPPLIICSTLDKLPNTIILKCRLLNPCTSHHTWQNWQIYEDLVFFISFWKHTHQTKIIIKVNFCCNPPQETRLPCMHLIGRQISSHLVLRICLNKLI